jgi:hypothetical protein
VKFFFWNVLPCSQIDVDRRFRGACCLHHQGVLKSMSTDVSEVHAASIIRAVWEHGSTSHKTLNFVGFVVAPRTLWDSTVPCLGHVHFTPQPSILNFQLSHHSTLHDVPQGDKNRH